METSEEPVEFAPGPGLFGIGELVEEPEPVEVTESDCEGSGDAD